MHDAARPCLTGDLIDAVFAAAQAHGAALLAIPVADTVKRVGSDGLTTETLPRNDLYLAQTPQVFRRDVLLRAYANRSRLGAAVTDDTQLVEAIGQRCAVVGGSPRDHKITTPTPRPLASAVRHASALPKPKAVNTPAHPFADEQAMWGNTPKRKPSDLF